MPSAAGKPVVGPDWEVIERPWGLSYRDPKSGKWLSAKDVEPGCGGGQVDEGWAHHDWLREVKQEPAAPVVKKEPAASPSPPGFSFASPPPFGASRAAPPTTFKASPPEARPAAAAARSPARKRCAAAAPAGAGASSAKRPSSPATLPFRYGSLSLQQENQQARSDSSSPGYSITLSPPPIHHTPPHPSRGEVRTSSSSGSGRRSSAAPRSPTEECPGAASARGRAAAGNGRQRTRNPVSRLRSKVRYKIKTTCAYTGNRLRVEHFGEAAVRKLEELTGNDTKFLCLDLVGCWFKREYDGGRVTHVSSWLLRALDKAAKSVMQEV